MALEKSVLTYEDIVALVKKEYGIPVQTVTPLPLGSANCYALSDGAKRYFLKEFQSGFSPAQLQTEAALVAYLAEHHIPTVPFYFTHTNQPYFWFRERCITLSAYADGVSYGYDDLPAAYLPTLARMLGRLHRVLNGYPLPEDMGEDWVAAYTPEKLAGQYEALLTIAERRQDDPYREHILADLSYKKNLAYRLQQYVPCFRHLTRCATHGDYQSCQCLWENGEIRGVVDFSAARVLPVVWEIMRSFVQSSPVCRNRAVLDGEALAAYVGEYQTVAPLTEMDLEAMPYVYLFQLARSRYGYKQYLSDHSPDGTRLLAFAFWRTEMCRQVEQQAAEIVKKLK